MRLSSRSFPYPVIGNEDDVDAEFQATIEPPTCDGVEYVISVHIETNSTTLKRAITDGWAKFVVHVECGRTHFRAMYDFITMAKIIRIPAQSVQATVEVNVLAVATRDIKTYKVKNAHGDYEGRSFFVPTGGILAVSEGQSFDADLDLDSMQRIDSIVQLVLGTDDQQIIKIGLENDKIEVMLPPEDFLAYKKLKGIPALAASLIPALVLPALVQALALLSEEPEEASSQRWARCLRKRLQEEGLTAQDDPFESAQLLLKAPIRRAFTAATTLVEELTV